MAYVSQRRQRIQNLIAQSNNNINGQQESNGYVSERRKRIRGDIMAGVFSNYKKDNNVKTSSGGVFRNYKKPITAKYSASDFETSQGKLTETAQPVPAKKGKYSASDFETGATKKVVPPKAKTESINPKLTMQEKRDVANAPKGAVFSKGSYAEYANSDEVKEKRYWQEHPTLNKLVGPNSILGKVTGASSKFNDVAGAKMRQTMFGDQSDMPTTGNKTADTIANVIGTAEGFFMPSGGGAPSFSGPVSEAANAVTRKIATSKLVPELLRKSGLAQTAIKGAVESLPYTGWEAAANKYTPKETLEATGRNALLGVGGEIVGYGVGKGIDKLKGLSKGKQVVKQVAEEAKQFEPSGLEMTGDFVPKKSIPKVDAPTVKNKPIVYADGSIGSKQTLTKGKATVQEMPSTKSFEPKLPKAKAETAAVVESNLPIGQKTKDLSFPKTALKADITAPELKQMIKDNPLSYKPINNADTLKYAQSIVDGNFDAAKNLVKQGESLSNATETAIAQDVIRRLQDAKQWDEAFEVMEATAKKAKTSGQAIQALSMWNRMTPEGMLKYAQRTFDKANDVLPEGQKIKLTPETAEQITEAMKGISGTPDELIRQITQKAGKLPGWAENAIRSKTTDELKNIAVAQVLSDIADKIPSSTAKKISTFQAMSHLLNVKTTLRNVLGNVTFSGLENLSNAIAVPFDRLLSLKTGSRSLLMPSIKNLRSNLAVGAQRAKESALDIALGIDRTGVNEGKYNVPIGKTFKGGILGQGEKALKYSLNVPDEFSKGATYNEVLQQQMKLAGVDTPTQDMMQLAEDVAKYRTFQDNSLPARMLQKLKEAANTLGTNEFGAGDLLIKYTKVPGNLISRAVEYSPAGFIKVLKLLRDSKVTGKFNQYELSMTIGRGLTGSLLLGMGALMNRMGLLVSEDKEGSKNALALDRAEGLGNYKVNISAIDRLLSGGSGEPVSGDTLFSYSWLQPISAGLAAGAAIDQEMKKGGDTGQAAFKAGNAALEEMLDIPTLTTIKKMVYADNAFDVAITPITEGASGFVPSPIRQASQALDPISRDTKGSTPLETLGNKVKSSIPVLRNKLEPRLSPFGQEIRYPSDVFNSFINPGQTSAYNPSSVTDQLKKLEKQTGETGFYPSEKAPNSFDYNKQTIVLTPEEKTLFMQMAGTEVLNSYETKINSSSFSNMTPDKKVDVLEKMKDLAREKAKREILRRRGLLK